MNIKRRRGAIALSITLGVLLVGGLITYNIAWIILYRGRIATIVLGIFFCAVLTTGVVLLTVFLVREVRRNERQDSFLNAVTHELKTPIASIRLYLETLQRREVAESQRQEFYKIMLADSDRLLSTVEQVLKAGELGAREPHQRGLLEFAPLVQECISITLQRHHLPLDAIQLSPVPLGVRLHVRAFADDLKTAVLNVLDNAVLQYSPDGVHVRCSLAIVRYTQVALTVADTGLGVEPKQLKRIFKRFYRVPGRNAVKIKGTGLGLFLVKTILQQHGGAVSATSAGANLGTTITLKLPLANDTGQSAD